MLSSNLLYLPRTRPQIRHHSLTSTVNVCLCVRMETRCILHTSCLHAVVVRTRLFCHTTNRVAPIPYTHICGQMLRTIRRDPCSREHLPRHSAHGLQPSIRTNRQTHAHGVACTHGRPVPPHMRAIPRLQSNAIWQRHTAILTTTGCRVDGRHQRHPRTHTSRRITTNITSTLAQSLSHPLPRYHNHRHSHWWQRYVHHRSPSSPSTAATAPQHKHHGDIR